jgi:hypothetical protein
MRKWPYLILFAVLIAGVAASSIHNVPRITPAEAGPPMMQVVAAGSTVVAGGAGSVSVEGSTYTTTETADSSSNSDVTIPSGANLAIVGIGGYGAYPNTGTFSSGSVTLDSQSCTMRVGYDSDNEAQMAAIFTCSGFTSGSSKTIAWDWDGTGAVQNANIFIIFVSGADTANPVRDSGGEIEKADDNTASTGSMTAQTGDYIFAISDALDNGTPSINWTGATSDSSIDDSSYSECAEASPSGSTTVSTTCTDCANYMTIAAVVIQPE